MFFEGLTQRTVCVRGVVIFCCLFFTSRRIKQLAFVRESCAENLESRKLGSLPFVTYSSFFLSVLYKESGLICHCATE